MNKILNHLFSTNAIEVSMDEPFWYASGEFGPFYINTHYLYGNKEKATSLLTFIDKNKESIDFENKLSKLIMDNYSNDIIFNEVINECVNDIKQKINISNYKYISGGERRDWFFSIPISNILKKEHVFLYKSNKSNKTNLNQSNVLHICDLVNTASSYVKSWKPIINRINGIICDTYTVVDRNQGGGKILKNIDISLCSLFNFDIDIFEKAYKYGNINERQYDMLKEYLKNSKDFMLNYIKSNSNYLNKALKADEKSKLRAQKFIRKYNL